VTVQTTNKGEVLAYWTAKHARQGKPSAAALAGALCLELQQMADAKATAGGLSGQGAATPHSRTPTTWCPPWFTVQDNLTKLNLHLQVEVAG
jgi:hypothetical protein